jgi:type II secretory pathway component PulF
MVTPAELNRRAELYSQLAAMIAAGVPLVKALEMAGRNRSLRSSQKTILELIQHLQAGLTFTDSMKHVQGWMPEFDIALLSVGEETGRLDVSFKQLSQYYEFRAKIIRNTISDLLITGATLHVFLLVFPLGLLTAFVLGVINNNYHQCIPFIIEKSIVYGGLWGTILFLIFACQGKRGEGWRSLVENLSQMIPLFRTAQKYLVLSRLSAALHALTNAGVSVIKGWELAAAASGSPRLKREVATWAPHIEGGVTPAEMINQVSYFPETFANLYFTAENSGKLDETLDRLHIYYQEEGFRALHLFTRILNGVIYATVVVLVAYNVIGFYVGYFNAAMNAF